MWIPFEDSSFAVWQNGTGGPHVGVLMWHWLLTETVKWLREGRNCRSQALDTDSTQSDIDSAFQKGTNTAFYVTPEWTSLTIEGPIFHTPKPVWKPPKEEEQFLFCFLRELAISFSQEIPRIWFCFLNTWHFIVFKRLPFQAMCIYLDDIIKAY